jgi:hypothetical protein
VLQAAVDGLLKTLAAWRIAAIHLAQLPHDQAQQLAVIVSQAAPSELRPEFECGEPRRRLTNPVGLCRIYDQGVAALNTLPADTPSLRLLADQTAEVLAGVSCALNGLALLVGDSARPVPRRDGIRLHVPNWFPPLADAARVFVALGAVELLWIVTAWRKAPAPSPSRRSGRFCSHREVTRLIRHSHEFHDRHLSHRGPRCDQRLRTVASSDDLRGL